jgi:hypothetical protein
MPRAIAASLVACADSIRHATDGLPARRDARRADLHGTHTYNDRDIFVRMILNCRCLAAIDAHAHALPTRCSYVCCSRRHQTSDWLSGLRSGAWEESWLRGPVGEIAQSERKGADAHGSQGASSTGHALVLHASAAAPSTPALPLSTPAHTSASLLDIDLQSSQPVRITVNAAKPPRITKADEDASAAPVTTGDTYTMPSMMYSYHSIAQQHTVVSLTCSRNDMWTKQY